MISAHARRRNRGGRILHPGGLLALGTRAQATDNAVLLFHAEAAMSESPNDNQLILVPQISHYPGHEARARAVVRWLVQQNIIEELPSTCGRGPGGMGYAIAAGARRVVEAPHRLPFDQPLNGMEIVYQRCIFTPQRGFLEEAGCPECRQEIGEALFASLDEWMPGHTDNFTCPLCGHEDDINGFLFLQPCGFSNLGFIFNNWADARFTRPFLAAFAERLGYPASAVEVRY
jgi:hypothetical protein